MKGLFTSIAGAASRARHYVLHGIWEIGRPGETIPSGFLVKQVRVIILLMRGLYEETVLLRASALTFATLLFIVPFFVFVFSFIQTFDLGEYVYEGLSMRVNTYLARAVEFVRSEEEQRLAGAALPEGAAFNTAALPARRAPNTFAAAAANADPDAGNRHLWRDLIKTVFPAWQPELDQPGQEYQDPVQLLVGLVEKRATNLQTLGISGAIYILVTVLGLMRNVEWTFNRIWGVPVSRNIFRTLSDYVVITLLLPFLAAAVLGITAALENSDVIAGLGGVSTALRIGQLAVICFTFAVVYYVVPNTRVSWRCALVGGIVAGLLWALLSWAYVRFNYGLARYTFFFSTFALFPMLLFWIYTSWLILLFGCLVSFAYQHEKTFALERLAGKASHGYRVAIAVRVVVEAARRFARGRPALTVDEAVEAWNVPTRLINEVLDDLVRGGLMDVRTGDPSGFRDPNHQDQVMYKPARDPRLISVLDIVRALRDAGRDPSMLRLDRDYAAIYEGVDRADPAYMQASVADLAAQLDAAAPQRAG